MRKFIIKHINNMKPQKKAALKEDDNKVVLPSKVENNKVNESKTVATTEEKIAMAQEILDGKKASAIELYLYNCGITDPSKQEEIFSWYREYTEKFVTFFKPIIKDLH